MKKGWKLFISFVIAIFLGGPLGETVSLGISPTQNTGVWVLVLWVIGYYVLGALFKQKPNSKN